jgi:hypothetical protein
MRAAQKRTFAESEKGPLAALFGGWTCALRSLHELVRLRADRPRNGDVFGHIKPPFLGLVFRHECLSTPDAGREFDLCDDGILARLDERLEQGLVEVRLR